MEDRQDTFTQENLNLNIQIEILAQGFTRFFDQRLFKVANLV